VKTISLKLPEGLHRKVIRAAKSRGLNQSEVVREAIEQWLVSQNGTQPKSALELAGDAVGSLKGPVDLSVNSKHLEGFGE
jgi:Arc/MetJ-type ribon-helix-helix transcriptional regulator